MPQLSETYESNVTGLFIVGALGGYPLIKQAMNQGYEVVESILGNQVEPADEPLLQVQVRQLGRTPPAWPRRWPSPSATCRCWPASRRCSCASSCSTAMCERPRRSRSCFDRNDYTNTFFTDRRRRGLRRDQRRRRGEPLDPLGRRTVLRRARPDFRPPARGHREGGQGCVLIETPRRSMLKLIASVDSVRKGVDAVFLRRAVRAYLSQDLPDDDFNALVERRGAEELCLRRHAVRGRIDAPDGLYLLRRGSVTVSRKLGGHEVVLSLCCRGQLCRRNGAAHRRAANGDGARGGQPPRPSFSKARRSSR